MLRTVLHFLPQPKKLFFHCKYCTKRFALKVSLIFSNVLHRFLMLEISTYTEISVSNPQTKKLSKIKLLKNFTIIVGEFSKNTRFPQNLNSAQTFLKKVHFDQFDFFTGVWYRKKAPIKKKERSQKSKIANIKRAEIETKNHVDILAPPKINSLLEESDNAHFTTKSKNPAYKRNAWPKATQEIFEKTSKNKLHKPSKSKPNEHTRTKHAPLRIYLIIRKNLYIHSSRGAEGIHHGFSLYRNLQSTAVVFSFKKRFLDHILRFFGQKVEGFSKISRCSLWSPECAWSTEHLSWEKNFGVELKNRDLCTKSKFFKLRL